MPLSSISSASFSFKKLPDFSPFFADRVRLGNRTYRVWVKIGLKDGELNGSAPSYVEFTLKIGMYTHSYVNPSDTFRL